MNNKFGMKDLFMNKELKGLFPQFEKGDKLQNEYSYEWVEKRVTEYIKSAFDGTILNGDIIIRGRFKEKFREISALKGVIEGIFNNMPTIVKNIRKNSRLITPFQCIDQLKQMRKPEQKVKAMQIVFDNLMYNDDFKYKGRKDATYLKNKEKWEKSVGIRR